MYFIIIVGPAGSGKSTLAAALNDWISSHGMDSVIINLDPAAENLQYTPDFDIRQYVDARDIMFKYKLGPNGALITAVDTIINHVESVREFIESRKANYYLIDTPGQMEIFAFRHTGPLILDEIIGDRRSVTLFLIDAALASRPTSFASLLFLAVSTYMRIKRPQIGVLSKIDLYPEEQIERIISWIEDPYQLLSDIREESSGLVEDIASALIETGAQSLELIPVSSITWKGLDELYAAIQRVVAGGEDYFTEEPSEIY
ncbi:MAG: ATP/GTP-binding protein [Sulfolobales archaeon]